MTFIRDFFSRGGILVALVLVLSISSCKSKKKAREAAAAAEKAKVEQAEAALRKEREEEERRRREAEAQARRDAEARASEPKTRLNDYFNAIATSNNVTSANQSINEALTLFASPDTPVLIVISEENGQKDYDRPTTIREYLNYLKDQKKNINSISNLQFDSAGKITEVELRKK